MTEFIGKPRQIDARNRITLPAQIMEMLKLKPNDEIYFKIANGRIIMGKALVKYEFIEEIANYQNTTKE